MSLTKTLWKRRGMLELYLFVKLVLDFWQLCDILHIYAHFLVFYSCRTWMFCTNFGTTLGSFPNCILYFVCTMYFYHNISTQSFGSLGSYVTNESVGVIINLFEVWCLQSLHMFLSLQKILTWVEKFIQGTKFTSSLEDKTMFK